MGKVAVIGAGPAGLAAAIAAAQAGAKTKVFEQSDRVGSKILATGNGRCNLTNTDMKPAFYNHPDFVEPILQAWDAQAIRSWFAHLGLVSVEERQGRVYPLSRSANSVLDVLRQACGRLGVRIITNSMVGDVRQAKADAVIVACGGGSRILESIGHSSVPFQPVLCSLATDTGPIRGLSGVRSQVRVHAFARDSSDRLFASEDGEVLFRDYGISGIVAFDMSRHVKQGDRLALDFSPGNSPEELEDILRSRMGDLKQLSADERIAYKDLMCGMFHPRINQALMRAASLKAAASVTYEELGVLARAIKSFSLEVVGVGDVGHAQVTRGGACVDEFASTTLESKLVSGVYACGEVLDVDGACGGYNLHWAWASGIVAGTNAAGRR